MTERTPWMTEQTMTCIWRKSLRRNLRRKIHRMLRSKEAVEQKIQDIDMAQEILNRHINFLMLKRRQTMSRLRSTSMSQPGRSRLLRWKPCCCY
jgi:hypothetical protein